MNPLEAAAGQAQWAAKNIAYNLDFIPPDKLDWKPAPTANSAMEIVNHVIGALKRIGAKVNAALGKGDSEEVQFATATNLDEAKQLLVAAAQEYSQILRSLKPEDLNKQLEMPFGTFPISFIAGMPVVDLIHHHGQIAYIQTLLGDTESHFDMSAL